MFLDEARIGVVGGHGGRGCVSWRREKYVPKGGPDGGNGGDGGNVYLIADENTDTLSAFASRKRFEAQRGRFGMGKNKNGRCGADLWLQVPPGTLVKRADGELLADLRQPGDQVLVAHGGRGGYGNAHFKSSTRQRPDFAELGEPGEQQELSLELKLVADVGIIGYPSVGKSTLISVISAARPKIADYPFTTLVPNLGVVTVDDRSFVVCDVPGLIEGASEGKGLGDQFLRHIERCGILLHLLDLSHAMQDGSMDPGILVQEYRAIRSELTTYSPALAKKREVVVLNKTDLTTQDLTPIVQGLQEQGIALFTHISAAAHHGINALVRQLLPLVLEERVKREREQQEAEEAEPLPVLTPHIDDDRMAAFRIERSEDGSLLVRGKRLEQLVRMTDVSQEGALRRFRDIVERIGLKRALGRAGMTDGTTVYIGDIQVNAYL